VLQLEQAPGWRHPEDFSPEGSCTYRTSAEARHIRHLSLIALA